MGDPVGAAKHAFSCLNDEGVIMLIEPMAEDDEELNFNTIGQMYYSFSTMACVPASKSENIGLALGAQAGPKKLINVFEAAGFSACSVVHKTATNMVIEIRK